MEMKHCWLLERTSMPKSNEPPAHASPTNVCSCRADDAGRPSEADRGS